MTRQDKITIAAVVLAAIALFGAGMATGYWGLHRETLIEERTDTTYIERVKTIYRPAPVTSIPVATAPLAFVFLTDTLYVGGDTTIVTRSDTLVRESKHYDMDDCEVWASGYDVAVDSAYVKHREVIIEHTAVQYVPRDIKPFSVYARAQGGAILPYPYVSVGGGVEWTHNRWHIYGEAGYSNNFQNRGNLYMVGGVKVDLFRFGK